MAQGLKITLRSNADRVAKEMAEYTAMIGPMVGAVTQRNGMAMMNRTKVLAPYRTGEYRNSINFELSSPNPQHFKFEWGSDLDRGYRLELGFVGTTSTGQNIAQAPRPHFAIALAEGESRWLQELNQALTPRFR